jgi:multiple sugar transport system substrate-binding protein
MGSIGRRDVTRRILLAGASAALPCPVRAAVDGVRWVWWGNPERNRRTAAALKLFDAQYPAIKVTSESAAWPDYCPKVATEVAGRHAADVIQIDYRFLVEYARRGALSPLEGLMPKPLNLSGFDQSKTSTGMVDGKLYGVSVGGNAFAYLYNRAVFARLGIPEPKPGWTWTDFIEAAGAISKASPKGFWGAGDGSRQDDVLSAFLRQRGKNFFREDGQLDFVSDDVAKFFVFWDDLRKNEIVSPAAVTAAEAGQFNTNLLTTGKTAMTHIPVNELAAVQSMMGDPVAAATIPAPAPGKDVGNYLKPSQLMSIYSKSAVKEQGASLINFILTDPSAVSIVGIDRGVPESAVLRAMLRPKLAPVEQMVVEYVDFVSKTSRPPPPPPPPPPPKGAGQIITLLPRVADRVAFKQVSIKAGAKEFYESLTAMVKQG